ncbi:chitooligosaccharidolytic beta-N-acetylglucosaminidase-like isoform X2 [Lutzomyia longipalpis]|uniref:chitooligosaccharidolytic beta-N-acetylglucosaminidase-like isoform X2 n=1 Tax=Lutzomyia longipalpis TaxID=7200 RepID=UPI0024837DD5|nr:chitooligosaccharidolytic beta-N-acetylglucosaminidase-like isoform X2 [Lutzomyia longipalpis]
MRGLIGLAVGIICAVGAIRADSPKWGYECIQGRCKKVESLNRDDVVSLGVCRLFCGEDIGTLWPKPTGTVRVGNTLAHIDIDGILFKLPDYKSQQTYWEQTQQRFFDQIKAKVVKNHVLRHGGKKVMVDIAVDREDLTFDFNTDESYKVDVKEEDGNVGVKITAPTYYGARHGVETLAQLIVYDNIRTELQIPSSVNIEDAPVFKHRGISLDTSRNYFSVDAIKKTIDALAMVKLNTFHWHITDSHSFPVIIKSHPDLADYGAYTPEQIYTADDVRDVVRYARIRGVRVIPEFDAPAHVGEGWQKKGMTVCFNAQPWSRYCVEPPCGQFDPSKDALYGVLEDIYREFNEMFEEPFVFHMGGDEVSVSCWNSSTELQQWMLQRGWQLEESDFMRLWGYFQDNALQRWDKVARAKVPIILWTSRLTDVPYVDDYLDKDRYIIQIWTKGDDPKIEDLLNRGFNLIFSNYDALYFDCGFQGWVSDGHNWCSPYIGWQKVYDNSLSSLAGSKVKQVLGAEAALWSEQADDSALDSRFWPRASALAERLWTDPTDTWRDAESRMLIHRERLVENGVAADSLQPQWCLQNEGDCPNVL